jgi:hypothetical protein
VPAQEDARRRLVFDAETSLPIDDDIIWRLFGEDVSAGAIRHPMDISDVWKNSYSENTSQKVWAAKYTARHPNLVALELSSFKCGHDAPIYTVVEETVTSSGTPYFSFKDIDENKPTGSIKIRVETISYFLKRYREDMVARRKKQTEIDAKLKELEHKLRSGELSKDGVRSKLTEQPFSVPAMLFARAGDIVATNAGRIDAPASALRSLLWFAPFVIVLLASAGGTVVLVAPARRGRCAAVVAVAAPAAGGYGVPPRRSGPVSRRHPSRARGGSG